MGLVKYSMAAVFFYALFSCQREQYDPSKYEGLLFSYVAPPPPPKEYIFKAVVGGKTWDTRGSAFVSNDTLVIQGKFGNEVLLLRFKGLGTITSFVVAPKRDSAAFFLEGESTFKYASINRAKGTILLSKYDAQNNQVEGNFNLVLYSRGTDSLVISGGYFKINYSANSASFDENEIPVKIDTVGAFELPDSYKVYCKDTVEGRVLVLVIPKNLPSGFGGKIVFGSVGGLPTAYYTYPLAKQYGFKDSTQAKGGVGSVTISSFANNVVKGRFEGVDFYASPADEFPLISLTNGTFSAEY